MLQGDHTALLEEAARREEIYDLEYRIMEQKQPTRLKHGSITVAVFSGSEGLKEEWGRGTARTEATAIQEAASSALSNKFHSTRHVSDGLKPSRERIPHMSAINSSEAPADISDVSHRIAALLDGMQGQNFL